MPVIARFSDGSTDTYKGKRPVKAAWQITYPNGKTASGHSIDRATAEKTARGYIKYGDRSPRHRQTPARSRGLRRLG